MEVLWPIFLAALIGLFIIYHFFAKKNRFQVHGVPTQNYFVTIFNTVRLFTKRLSMIDNVNGIYNINKDAKYIGIYDFSYPVVMLRDIELIKNITVKNFDNFVDHRLIIDPEVEPLFGKNLFSLRGDKWREVRSLLSPAFTSSKMKTMFTLMSDCAEIFVNNILEQSAKEPIEVNSKDILTRYTNDTIATCAFGVSVDSMSDPNNEFYVLGKKATTFDGFGMIKFLLARISPRLLKFLGLRLVGQDVHDFFMKLVKETITTRDEKGIVRPDMLQLMMEARGNKAGSKHQELDIESMTSQAFIFFFGGFDTVSNAMCFVVHEIAANTEIREKLQREIDEVYEKCNGDPTYEAVQNMEYLDAVINEVLRLYPVGVMLERQCTGTFELPPALPNSKPFLLQPGDIVWVPVWSIHRSAEYYPEPDKLCPERFVGDAKHNANASTYMPFGVGPRMCLGNRFALLEIKVLVLRIFAKCNVNVAKKMIMPLKISNKSLNLTAEGGFWLDIEPRNRK